jgi:hypothetical protein
MDTASTEYARAGARTAPHARGRSQSPVKVLLAVLAVLLLALGCLGWWWLKKMETEYSHMISDSVVTMNRAQDIGTHASMGYGNLMELRQTHDPEKRAELLLNMKHEREVNDRLYEQLDRTLTDPDLRARLADVMAKRLVTRKLSDGFKTEMVEGAAAGPDSGTSLQLLHAFIAYMQACDHLVDGIQDTSMQACKKTTGEIERLRWLFLGVGVLPFAAALVLLSAILILLRVLPLSEQSE